MMKLPKAIKRMEEDCLRLNEEEYSLKYGEVALKFYHYRGLSLPFNTFVWTNGRSLYVCHDVL